ncbi:MULTISPECIES: SusC/RagA family TonB-linked outer membrane protein [unclassified Tenacibaculum]|uniref:SusC/RagA family TonB-linked outer membrane protein n=1 Tax=unclassified Tenacibaculum TaxID=2635139 RepID=UPI001F396177|nr:MULTISPECIES: SusC/RagA family TonB-linked outer membrane protein [unclassified Tenacibaculum]MCF2873294.1 SusC/RagA family TonB-linked outer membrane protein [Tenacibaculum sp. Cn5-1]MCF2933450.1 SusC/RagA family TonB-linked outer membrane protein [Tenacibaculum sp. Cn5-34]MCG7509969.1 SusC/RagA family TonB-linked outer membrane protein [Tenacibaculum sp. Cn5-46]
MKTKFNGILTLFLALLVQITFAQERTISGVVSDETGPLPGVNVLKKGTTAGVETNFDGQYSIKAKTGDVLVFSFVGMKTIEKTIGTENTINISMVNDNVLDEVVVTALGVSREKRSLGYSTQSVKGNSVAENRATNVTNALSGKIAGVQIKSSAGNIGGSTKVLLRGNSSITGNNNPLYVIDGTPIADTNFNSLDQQVGSGGKDYGNLTSDLNPDDIESINVLKGGAATALYGARGGNGVIMITTKKGKNRKGIGITLNTNVTFDKVYILPDYQNEYAGGYSQTLPTIGGQNALEYGADESWGPRMDGTPVRHWSSWLPGSSDFGQTRPLVANPDNVRNFFETGVTISNNIAFSGGNETSTFRVSLGNTDQNGIMPNSTRKVNTVSFNGSHKLTEKLTAKISVNYAKTDVVGRPTTGYDFAGGKNVVTSFNQWFQRQLNMDVLRANYKSATGQPQSWNMISSTNPKPQYWDNPYWIVNESYSEDTRNRVYGNVGLSYQVNDKLNVSATARTDFYTFRIQDRTATYSLSTDYYEESVREGREDNFELFATYQDNINDDFGYTVNFQANTRLNSFHYNSARTNGGLSVPNFFNVNASKDRPTLVDENTKRRINSLALFGSFSYKNMLYLDWSARQSWSSTLPLKSNDYFYPSLSTSFIFSELIDSDIISFGKLRAGWAKIRQDTNPYQLNTVYTTQDPIGDSPAFAVPNRSNNPNLVPELFEEYEIGLEMKMFQNRFGFDATYYDKTSTDLILPLNVSGTSGITSAWVNAGKMTNKGVELAVYGTPIKNDDFRWDINVNWAKNTNKVLELAEGSDNLLINSWGPSVNARIGEAYGAIVTDGFKYHANGQRIVEVDTNGNYTYARETNKVVGNVTPDFTGGVMNNFKYKNFTLGFLVDFQKGGDIYSVSNRYGDYSGLTSRTAGLNDKGNPLRDPVANGGGIKVEGVDVNGNPVSAYTNPTQYFKSLRVRRENYVYDASYVKLREVTLGYSFPKQFIKGTPFQDVRLSLVGRNLWLISSNAPNIDPEATLGSGNTQGFENGQIPSTRSIGFNLNVKF